MRRKRGSHCRQRHGSEVGIFAKNLAQSSDPGTNRQHRVEVTASNLIVMGSDPDRFETCSFQNATNPIGVSERERSRRSRILGGLRRQMSGRGSERHEVERVLLQRAPADEGNSPVRPEAATNVDERRRRVCEEHYPKSRESGVERGWFEWEDLRICLNEPHALASFGRALRERKHRRRKIDPHYGAVRRDCPSKVQRRLASTTPYVQDVLARSRRKRFQSVPAKRSEL